MTVFCDIRYRYRTGRYLPTYLLNPNILLRWSNDGKHFVSASVDGSIKIWDAVSNRCIATFLQAHDGDEVCSVTFSRNSKYVLSSGKVP